MFPESIMQMIYKLFLVPIESDSHVNVVDNCTSSTWIYVKIYLQLLN